MQKHWTKLLFSNSILEIFLIIFSQYQAKVHSANCVCELCSVLKLWSPGREHPQSAHFKAVTPANFTVKATPLLFSFFLLSFITANTKLNNLLIQWRGIKLKRHQLSATCGNMEQERSLVWQKLAQSGWHSGVCAKKRKHSVCVAALILPWRSATIYYI